jgi:hypothetical protein
LWTHLTFVSFCGFTWYFSVYRVWTLNYPFTYCKSLVSFVLCFKFSSRGKISELPCLAEPELFFTVPVQTFDKLQLLCRLRI